MGKAGNQSSTSVGIPSPAWLEYKKRLTEAWKEKPPRSGLAILTQQFQVPIEVVAEVLCREYPRRRVGRPGGLHWESPHYVVAYMVAGSRAERRMATNEGISDWIEAINRWAFMRGKTALNPEPGSRDHERVKRLVPRLKRQRL
jgi:hypothetical protein